MRSVEHYTPNALENRGDFRPPRKTPEAVAKLKPFHPARKVDAPAALSLMRPSTLSMLGHGAHGRPTGPFKRAIHVRDVMPIGIRDGKGLLATQSGELRLSRLC